jgi:hypothetical protein
VRNRTGVGNDGRRVRRRQQRVGGVQCRSSCHSAGRFEHGFPISDAVAEEFQKANPGIRVTVGISGTGGGFQKFCRAETDISDASRPIRPTEIETCQKASIEYIELPIA